MDFNFTEEQGMVRDGLSRLVREQYGFEERRKAIASAEGWRPEVWSQLAELGILGMPFSEADGGFGGGAVDAGAREITLLGQNVNAWEDADGRGLHDLIRAMDRISGLSRIRYTTSHPNDMRQGLIDAHRDVESLMPFLHLPVQAGADRVLKAMNRSHTRDGYLRLLDRIRDARPDIALSGDFIVGFPGETEAEFAETLSLVDAVGYAQAFSFKYSPRPGTPAADMTDQVAPEVMDDRLQRLQAALNRDQAAFNAATLGQTCSVLVERRGKLPGQWLGKSPWLQSVHLIGDYAIGDVVEVTLTQAGPNSLAGEPRVAVAA